MNAPIKKRSTLKIVGWVLSGFAGQSSVRDNLQRARNPFPERQFPFFAKDPPEPRFPFPVETSPHFARHVHNRPGR